MEVASTLEVGNNGSLNNGDGQIQTYAENSSITFSGTRTINNYSDGDTYSFLGIR